MKTNTRALIGWLVSVLLLIGLAPAHSAAAALPKPTGLKALSTSTTAIGLAWTPVEGAPLYRVQYSKSSSMSGSKYLTVDTASAELTGLSAGKTYYIKTRVVSADGAGLSSYSAALTVKTRSSGYSYLAPTGLAVTAATPTSLALSWNSRGEGIRYRVSWSKSSTFSGAKYIRETSTSLTLTGLDPATKYYLKVRVITTSGSNLSAYSPKISATTSSDLDLAAPADLTLVKAARTAVALAWTAADEATTFDIQYSRYSSMSSSAHASAAGRDAEVSGLTKGVTYYFRIRAVSKDGVALSPYSSTISVKTPTSTSSTYLPPSGLAVIADAPAKLTATWKSRGTGLTYQVQYSTDPGMANVLTTSTTSTKVSIGGLTPSTTYYLRVRVITSSGTALSWYNRPVVEASTSDAEPTKLVVASYNIKCANCYGGYENEGTWYERRDVVVANVLAQKPDVIGFQEASQAWLEDADGNKVNLSQFEDLVKRMGAPYKLTNTARNNCVKSTTPSNCTYKDQGASQGTKIIYNSDVLTLLAQGSKKLTELRAKDNDRYVAWAIFEHKATGKRFFFADTHLEHIADTAGSTTWYDLKVTQTKEGLAEIAAHNQGLPTYFVGDFNSNKWSLPANGPYDAVRATGLIDPLGNTYRSTTTAPGAIVQKRIRTNFSSYNDYKRKAPSFSYINGTYIDYVFTSPGIEVPEWETVVDVDADGNFIGTIPSDHNLLRVTTTLP